MGTIFSDLGKRSPGLLGLWGLGLALLLMVIVLYIVQNTQMKSGGEPTVRNLANAMGGVGIALCIVVAVWAILLMVLIRNSQNVWSDASSIYVSRHNLLLNWFTASPPEGAISGNAPVDVTKCYVNPGATDDPTVYDGYKALVKAYEGTVPVNQNYIKYDGSPMTRTEDMLTQQKLSFAYYRYVYCVKAYLQDIAKGISSKDLKSLPFLSSTAQTNLIMGKSCLDGGPTPDTQPCTNGVAPSSGDCAVNPCYVALNQTIAAQCLLYDDHVYNLINASVSPKGVIDSMELAASSSTNYAGVSGYQVLAPLP